MVNVGETFDLVNIKTRPPTATAAEFATTDTLANNNVTSITLEVPIACLTEGKGTIIGGWTTASVPATACSAARRQDSDATPQTGDFVQVSRLGMPLVNEVVIGLKDKNKFNGSEPKDDAQFADYVTNPTLPALLEALFGGGREGADQFPAHRSRRGVPDGRAGAQQAGQRGAVGDAAPQHRDPAAAQQSASACWAATTPASPTAAGRGTTSSTSSCAWRWACCAR